MMGSNDTNCLNKKNLTVVDYNSNMGEISSKSITHTQYNNNLHPINFSDEISCKIKREQSEKNQNSKGICILCLNFIFYFLHDIKGNAKK